MRTDSAIDSRSRQLFVVAQVDDPSGRLSERAHPLKIGEFVEAQITGRLLQNVYTIPRTAIIRGSQVHVTLCTYQAFHTLCVMHKCKY